jgi:hypothetical protein
MMKQHVHVAEYSCIPAPSECVALDRPVIPDSQQ